MIDKDDFKEFYKTFTKDGGKYPYREAIHEMFITGKKSLNIDFDDLIAYDGEIAEALKEEPSSYLPSATRGINLMLEDEGEEVIEDSPHARFFNSPLLLKKVGDIRADHLDRLVSIEAIVTRVTEAKPEITLAYFKCRNCGELIDVPQQEEFMTYPAFCTSDSCRKRGPFELDYKASTKADWQALNVQDRPETMKAGVMPRHISAYLRDDLIEKVVPGNAVILTGVLKWRAEMKGRKQKKTFSKYMDVCHIEIISRSLESLELTKEEIIEIEELSKDPMIKSKIITSISPAIYGYDPVKEAIALMMFGGVRIEIPDGTMIRGDSHVLLIGDPGTAKCVTGDTEVMLSDGSLKPIRDIVESAIKKNVHEVDDGVYAKTNHGIVSLGLDGRNTQARCDVAWKRDAPKKMYALATASGKLLNVTPTHPLFVCTNGRITSKRAEDIREGDAIATPRKIDWNGESQKLDIPYTKSRSRNAVRLKLPSKTSPEFWRYIAIIIGDGCNSSSQCVFVTNNDPEILDEFIAYSKQIGLNPKWVDAIRKGTCEVYVSSVEFGSFLLNLGIGRNSWERAVPSLLFKCSKQEVKLFLSALFDSGGSINNEKSRLKQIEMTSASERMLRQVRHLLLRFGIMSSLHANFCRAANSPSHEKTKYWKLIICGGNVDKFNARIGFSLPRKRRLLDFHCSHVRIENTNVDTVPNLSGLLKDTRLALRIFQRECGVSRGAFNGYENGYRNPSRRPLNKIATAFENRLSELDRDGISLADEFVENIKMIRMLSESDIFWDKVEKVETFVPKEKVVYDLQVPKYHNFIANDIFVHNSQLLRYTANLAPKSVYTTGKGASAAGLTAAAVKDEESGSWALEAGALVLASGGCAMIDEFDKMRDEDREAIHQAMEQQVCSVTKAGIVAELNTQTSILAAANPKMGRFEEFAPAVEQINLSPAILTRFDLVFRLEDKPEEKKDTSIGRHMLDVQLDPVATIHPPIPQDKLRKYMSYAKQNVHPKLTREITDYLLKEYVKMRKKSSEDGMMATPRQLETMVRLTRAGARMRLDNTVNEEDAARAVKLLVASISSSCIDPVTHIVDLDAITTGKTKSQRDKIRIIMDIVRSKENDTPNGIKRSSLIEICRERGIDKPFVERALPDLIKNGSLFQPTPGFYKTP